MSDDATPLAGEEGLEHVPAADMLLYETLSFDDLRNTSMLWLINRAVFHPRGYAMALVYDRNNVCIGWQLMGDGSEIYAFPYQDDEIMFRQAQEFLASDHKLKR